MKRKRKIRLKKSKFGRAILFVGVIVFLLGYMNSPKAENDTVPAPVPARQNTFYCESSDDEFINLFLSRDFFDKVRELKRLFGPDVSIVYQGLTQSNFFIKHNEETAFYGASIVKMALGIYIYREAELTPGLLDKRLAHKSSHYAEGTGVMQYMDLTRPYTIRELVKYLIEDSDNIAFYMLLDEFNSTDVRKYWNSLNTTYTFVGWDRFGQINGSDAQIYAEELYRYLRTDTGLSSELGQYFLNAAKNSIIQSAVNEPIYFKYGETMPHYHEVSIVSGKHPYILVIITNLLDKGHYDYIKEAAARVDELNARYWQERTDYCAANHTH